MPLTGEHHGHVEAGAEDGAHDSEPRVCVISPVVSQVREAALYSSTEPANDGTCDITKLPDTWAPVTGSVISKPTISWESHSSVSVSKTPSGSKST